MGTLNNMERSTDIGNRSLGESMSDMNKSNLESKSLNSDISLLNKENGNLNNIEKGINGVNKPLDKTINKPNLENTAITSKSPLNSNKLNENNINSKPSMLSGYIKQNLFNQPIVKNNYEKGISVGQTALNSLNKVKNSKISKNKKR